MSCSIDILLQLTKCSSLTFQTEAVYFSFDMYLTMLHKLHWHWMVNIHKVGKYVGPHSNMTESKQVPEDTGLAILTMVKSKANEAEYAELLPCLLFYNVRVICCIRKKCQGATTH